MNKQAKSKLTIYILFAILLLIGIKISYAYLTISTSNPAPASGAWSTNGNLYINFTPTISNYDNFNICGADNANVGANITAFDVNLTADWLYPNSPGNYTMNATYRGMVNGTTAQFNVTGLPQTNTNAIFRYRFIVSNQSSGGTRQNICGINYTETTNIQTISVDSILPVITSFSNPGANDKLQTVTPFFGATVLETNPSTCTLFHNATGTMTQNVSTVYLNNTNFNFSVAGFPNINGAAYFWKCTDLAGNINSTNNVTFSIDTTNPTITLNTPSNGSWSTTANVNFNFTVTDTNLQSCNLLGNFTQSGADWTSDATGINVSNMRIMISGSSTGSIFNASLADDLWNDGGYKYALRCNDTYGRTVQSQNFSVFVDKTTPSQFVMLGPVNRTSSAHRPNFTINNTIDTNFLTYSLEISDDNTFTSIVRNQNFTNNNSITLTQGLNQSTLSYYNYTWRISAYDRAGNVRRPVNGSLQFGVDQICYNLTVGYNYCGNIQDGFLAASTIAADTGSQFVYQWNASHVYNVHTLGTSTNAQMNFTRGDVIVLFINSTNQNTALWETRVWHTNVTRFFNEAYNFTNTSGSGGGYNVLSVESPLGSRLGDLQFSMDRANFSNFNPPASGMGMGGNGSIKYISYANNSALWTLNLSKTNFLPFRWNSTINNNTLLQFGEVYWAYYINSTGLLWNRSFIGSGGYG